MPRDTRTVSMFLASPNDVSPERELVAQTVSEWNQIRGRDRAINFELLRWETNVSSGFAGDGQQVVTSQIGDEYDALIAIFWTRVGTETPRAESGSIEEYERALTRRQVGEAIEIAFFFKDAPVLLKNIDLDQAKKVEELKARVRGDGALSKDFADHDTLRFEINLLLDRLARKFSRNIHAETDQGNGSGRPRLPSISTNALAEPERNEDIGYVDVMESFDKHSRMTSEFLSEMTSRFESMTIENGEVTARIEELAKLGPAQPSVIKPLIARVTAGMNRFSEFLEAKSGEYAENSMGIAEDTRALIDLSRDFATRQDDINALEATLVGLLAAMDGSIESIEGVRNSTEGLQRMTVAFNHARRRLVNNLNSFLSDLATTRDVVEKALEELQALDANPKPAISG